MGERFRLGLMVGSVMAGGAGAASAVSPLVVKCASVARAPRLDGDLKDAAWRSAERTRVFVHQSYTASGVGCMMAELRACWSGENIYLAVRWKDGEASLEKDLWIFDGGKWTKDAEQDEDRLGLVFPINRSVPDFAKYGCAVSCHGAEVGSAATGMKPRWYHQTNGPTERLDVWHWKSCRSNPVGFADDKFWDHRALGAAPRHAGRHPDGEPEGYRAERGNANAEGTGPARMQDPNKPPSKPGFLLFAETVPYKPGGFKKGDVIQGRMLSPHKGSRGDVRCAGVHRDKHWTVEFARKLNTGHEDDVVFEPGTTIPFSLAIFENVPEYRKHDHGRAYDVMQLRILPVAGASPGK